MSGSDECNLVIAADVDATRAEELAREYSCQATTDWQAVVNHPQVDAVIVSTINKYLMPITVAALQSGKHVLCEKPLGRNVVEAGLMAQAASDNHVILKTGFNHRHHPAIWKAHELCFSGAIGPVMFIRCVYGHGGRPGYDKEWRADADLAGGGELLDQGVHIVDLCRWFLGDFGEVLGATATYFWDLGHFGPVNSERYPVNSKSQVPSSKPQLRTSDFSERSGDPALFAGQLPTSHLQLEDNGFAMLRTAAGQIATLHTSWTQWKNRFTFEVFGRDGYVIVDGLGGSYGTEQLKVGRRRAEGGPPEEQSFEFSQRSGDPDLSWQAEWQEFTSAIRENRQPLANGEDGLKAMQLIDAIYRSSRTGQVVKMEA